MTLAAWWDHVDHGRSTRGCIEVFVRHRAPCKVASIRSTGDELFSYAMRIGEWIGPDTIAVDCHKVSVTTSRTQNRLLAIAHSYGVKTLCTPTPQERKLRRTTREI